MGSDRDPNIAKYAELKPKSSVDDQLAMSKVYISRSWNLPPRIKPGRRPTRSQVAKPSDGNVQCQMEGDDESAYDSEERKKRQNRDAQRAYRERRANKLLELEGVVETLQELVKNWQRKYKSVESELNDSKKRIESVEKENAVLQQKLKEVSASAQLAQLAHQQEIQDADVTLLDPLLQEMIDNFKPMKAVTLKRRKLPATVRDTASSSSHAAHETFDLTPVSAASVDCGFCSGGTTCVCKELADANAADDLDRCTEDTTTCEKCSDIDASCIKPQEVPLQVSVARKRCRSAPHDSGMPGKASVSLQTSVSLGNAESLIAEAARGGEKRDRNGLNELRFLDMSRGEQPNTMDPNFVPGSCTKCQKDPQSKAFCQAVYGSASSRDGKKSSCCGKGSCSK